MRYCAQSGTCQVESVGLSGLICPSALSMSIQARPGNRRSQAGPRGSSIVERGKGKKKKKKAKRGGKIKRKKRN